ncbi:hypothetical protein EDM80_12820 [bacterium]|nr:MAG: hypothetical protein EDM80_12820 [bacterium]RIK59704.1 MAG: hypothetical protein DCC64_15530 [Planctomycetota bacterium]
MGDSAAHISCPRCRKLCDAGGEFCIHCWAALSTAPVRWRHVYHAVNHVDAWLAKNTLELHGVAARIRDEHATRMMLHGHGNAVVEAAESDHLLAREVLRQVRGVRTDTEFLEWQELKHRRPARKILLGALALLAAAAAAVGGSMLVSAFAYEASESRPSQARR